MMCYDDSQSPKITTKNHYAKLPKEWLCCTFAQAKLTHANQS